MSLTKVIQSMIAGFEARTKAQLLTGPDPIYPGAYGPDPSQQGLQFWADDTAGNRKVFASIQTEIQNDTAGLVDGRLHFLTNDGNFLQIIATVDRDGSWILGPGAPAYIMNIAGAQVVNSVTPPGAIFGERVSALEMEYEDARVLAVRNCNVANLTSLNDRVGIGFSILNAATKERPVGYWRAQYSDRTSINSEDSYMYPTTLVNGVQIDGPYFHDGGIGFQLQGGALLPVNRLGAYEEGTWTPVFEGDSGSITGTYTVAPNGTYVVVGNLLYVSFYGYMTTPSGYPTGQIKVLGLPFAIKYGTAGRFQSILPGYVVPGAALSADGYRWQAGGNDRALLYDTSGNVNWSSGGAIEFSGSGVFELV